MRIASLTLPLLLLGLGACSLFAGEEKSEYAQPNSLMADEIENRVQQIPFQHRDELLQNLMWLAQTGETAIPTVLKGLASESPKVRSSCAWVLGRIRDRRTIPQLQPLIKDTNETVRLEVARSLVVLGDLKPTPQLIEGLDSERKEVRFLCHEALKQATGRDFGFDHLSDNETQRHLAVLGWRQWWSEYSGDAFFATSYQQRYHLDQPAQPMGEAQPQDDLLYRDPMQAQQPQQSQQPQPQAQQPGQPQQNDGEQTETNGADGSATPATPQADPNQKPHDGDGQDG